MALTQIEKNLNKAGAWGVKTMQASLGRPQPFVRSRSGRLRGLSPSAPGEYPKKLSGTLQKSIYFDSDLASTTISIETNCSYAPYLQNGTSRMAARPFMTLFWAQHSNTIANIILTGNP